MRMRKFLPFVLCGLAALSYSQLGAAADSATKVQGSTDATVGSSAGAGGNTAAGPTDNPNVARDTPAHESKKDKDKQAGPSKQESDGSAGSSSSKKSTEQESSPSSSGSSSPSSSGSSTSSSGGSKY
jgi:hypothetical protein